MTELPTTPTAEAAFLGYEARIAPELEPFAVPIGNATPHPENVRKHKLDKIAESLQRHGQRALVLVQQSSGHIVKGNGTYAAAQMLGWERLAMLFQEMTDEEALAFLYADNRASDLATYDRKKLRDGLKKMMDQPGLFDQSLWQIEEFEDLDEELRGASVLASQPSKAAFATEDGKSLAEDVKPKLPGEKMRDVSIVLTIADHALFVERIKILSKRFGTSGVIATIVEAVRRQAAAESIDTVETGRSLSEEAVYAAKREVVKEVRDYITTMGPDRNYSGGWLIAQLERMVPYRNPKITNVAPGQTGAFAEPESVPEGTISGVGQPTTAAAAEEEAGTDSGHPAVANADDAVPEGYLMSEEEYDALVDQA